MGATTVWERWDSMLPDGTINPGEMTSFNHYALGAVADWMHRTIGGIAPLAPATPRCSSRPRPGGGLTWAKASLDTPHGKITTSWSVDRAGVVDLQVEVPSDVTATVRLGGMPDQEVGAGLHRFQRTHLTEGRATVPGHARKRRSPCLARPRERDSLAHCLLDTAPLRAELSE